MTIKEIQIKLYENLKPTGWGDKLKLFLLSSEFEQILITLYQDSQEGRHFTPILKNLFRAFYECPYNELKIVMLNQDPYPTVEVADGIAFSCSTSTPELPLNAIFDEIERSIPLTEYTREADLKRWANQGILLLNTSLTVGIGKPNSHVELWRPFMIALFDVLETYNTGLIYIFFGNNVKSWHKSVNSLNYKFFPMHPSIAAFNQDKGWDSGNLFNQINKIVYQMYGEKIIW